MLPGLCSQLAKSVAACRSTSSLGGLWPGTGVPRFARQHLAAEWILSLLPQTALVLNADAGAICPLGGSATHITDRCCLAPACTSSTGTSKAMSVLLTDSSAGATLCICMRPCLCRACQLTPATACRFHLGGVGNNLRGFSYKGAGPVDFRVRCSCALAGSLHTDTAWQALAAAQHNETGRVLP